MSGKFYQLDMVDFTQQKKFKTTEPMLPVDPGLNVGSYKFRLTVVDENGNVSKPAVITIRVVRNLVITDTRLVTPIVDSPFRPIIR